MPDSMIESLFATIGADADLQARCRNAKNAEELRSAIAAAGFDPDHPEIVEALGMEAELDEQALEATAGGYFNPGWVIPGNLPGGDPSWEWS